MGNQNLFILLNSNMCSFNSTLFIFYPLNLHKVFISSAEDGVRWKQKKVQWTFFPPNRPMQHFRGRWGARRPGDVCLAPTEAERRMNPWVQLTLPLLKQKKSRSFDLLSFCFKCGRWDLNPHVYTNTRSLVLPVCQFQHFRMCTSISRGDLVIITNVFTYVNNFFKFFLFFLQINFFELFYRHWFAIIVSLNHVYIHIFQDLQLLALLYTFYANCHTDSLC